MSRFLVIGCGSIGERHTKNLLSLGQDVMVHDRDPVKLQNLVDKYRVIPYDFTSYHIPFTAWIIATPPKYHLPFAFEALNHNSHIFIEKPISHTLDRVGELLAKSEEQDRIIQVGYQFRFHPGLMLVKKLLDEGRIGKILSIRAEFGQYLPDWRPNVDYRDTYTAHNDQGGGIILDASHEVDYCRWLAGSEITKVSCFASKLSSLNVDAEDTAAILMRTTNNCIIEIHVDFTNRTYTRNCELIGDKGTIRWDYNLMTIYLFDGKEHNLIYDSKDDMYLEEMVHFLACIEGKEKPKVDGETGKRVLEIALAAKESAKENKVMEV